MGLGTEGEHQILHNVYLLERSCSSTLIHSSCCCRLGVITFRTALLSLASRDVGIKKCKEELYFFQSLVFSFCQKMSFKFYVLYVVENCQQVFIFM